jgi:hypothetical protein
MKWSPLTGGGRVQENRSFEMNHVLMPTARPSSQTARRAAEAGGR